MTFDPKYTITNQLLANIKRISLLVNELNGKRFSNVVLVEFERVAREVSSYASTSIEGNPLPLTEVRKILKFTPKNIRQSEQEVLNYNQALEKLHQKFKPLTKKVIYEIHSQVVAKLLPQYQTGKFRVEPVVLTDPRSRQIVYLPPDAQKVESLIDEVVAFIDKNKNIVDPLIIAGIFHKQFVVIHPFMDGNGRTARLATKVLLAQMGLNTFNLFSFENYYNQNVTRYFKEVGVFGDYFDLEKKIEFTSWLEYFTGGIIDELLRVQKTLSTKIASPKTSLQPHEQAVINFVKEKGYITNKDYSRLTARAKATRALDLRGLVSLGLIVKKGKGRATYYKSLN